MISKLYYFGPSNTFCQDPPLLSIVFEIYEVVHDIFGHERITDESKVLEDVEDWQVQLLLHMNMILASIWAMRESLKGCT